MKGGRWVRPGELGNAALPTLMKKIIALAAKTVDRAKAGRTKKPAYTGGAAGLIRQEPSVRGE